MNFFTFTHVRQTCFAYNFEAKRAKNVTKNHKYVLSTCVFDLNFAPIKGSVFLIFFKKSNSLYPSVCTVCGWLFYVCTLEEWRMVEGEHSTPQKTRMYLCTVMYVGSVGTYFPILSQKSNMVKY
jgi:hypothetical protein